MHDACHAAMDNQGQVLYAKRVDAFPHPQDLLSSQAPLLVRTHTLATPTRSIPPIRVLLVAGSDSARATDLCFSVSLCFPHGPQQEHEQDKQ